MILRPYQQAALDASKKKFAAGITRQLIALPTGTGKTPLFAMVRKHFGFQKKVMVLVHREELAEQAADKLRRWNPEARVGIEMANQRCTPEDDFVVASVPTIGRTNSPRLLQFNPDEFAAIVCDEAHHSTGNSYLTVFNHFGLLAPNCERLLIGCTATPNRGDGVPLAQVYDEIIYQMTILQAIREGWLVNLRALRVRTNNNLDGVHTLAGDFNQGELATEVNTPERNDVIVRTWLENAKDKSTVAFTVDIQHAKDLAARFRQRGVAAEAIWGVDHDREDKLLKHRNGTIKVLCNCGVLTEGYDDPNIGCIVLARPTKSNLLFVQMSGRGTRLQADIQNIKLAKLDGKLITKEDCLIMDVVDNTSKHSLVTLNSIFGLGNSIDPAKLTVTELVDKVAAARLINPNLNLNNVKTIAQLDATVSEVDLWKVTFPPDVISNSLLQWHQNAGRNSAPEIRTLD